MLIANLMFWQVLKLLTVLGNCGGFRGFGLWEPLTFLNTEVEQKSAKDAKVGWIDAWRSWRASVPAVGVCFGEFDRLTTGKLSMACRLVLGCEIDDVEVVDGVGNFPGIFAVFGYEGVEGVWRNEEEGNAENAEVAEEKQRSEVRGQGVTCECETSGRHSENACYFGRIPGDFEATNLYRASRIS